MAVDEPQNFNFDDVDLTGYEPDPRQIPPTVTTPEQLKRFKMCFAVTLLIAQRYDRQFCMELYDSDLPLDKATADAQQ